MGKKKDKLLKKQQQEQGQQQQPVPWGSIDADPMAFLCAPEGVETFLAQHWEQKPSVFKATPARVALFQGLCSLPAVLNWLKQREKNAGPLEFGVDVVAARYKNGSRETLVAEVADAATLQQLHTSDGCTLQLHQPQRFFDGCWRLLAALERQLGCLVGCNAYLTPAGTQGLAPHHDDVELWVVQTAGRKRWRLYEPRAGFHLPSVPSGDLDADTLGPVVMEVELNVGDCLYMPRGTVHQAEAVTEDSAHLTISTYQRCSYADLAMHVLQVGLPVQEEEARCLPLAARQSPAPGTLLQHSLHHVLAAASPATSTTPEAIAGLAGALRAIADKLESDQGAGMMTAAVQSTAIDFLMNRLPPHPKQLAAKGPAPTLDDSIWCRAAGWCFLMPFELTGMMCDSDDALEQEQEEGCVKLCSCLTNSREEHMLGNPPDDDSSSDEGSDEEEDDDEDGSGSDGDDEQPAAKSKAAAAAAAAADGNGCGGAEASNEAKKAKRATGSHGSEEGSADGEGADGHHCCESDGCGHDHDHDDSHAPPSRLPPVAAMPGVIFAPSVAAALVAFMAADTPAKAVRVSSLPLSSPAAQLQFAFALWAEELAATVQGKKGDSKRAAEGEADNKGASKKAKE